MKKVLIILGGVLVVIAIILAFVSMRGKDGSVTGVLPSDDANSFPSEGTDTGSGGNTRPGTSGTGGTQVFPGGTTGETSGVGVVSTNVKKLWDKPVVGATFYGSIKGETLTARFLEQETGHIYDHNIVSGQSRRVSGVTIPKIKNLVWGNEGQSIVFQYVDKDGIVKNYAGRVGIATTTEGGLTGSFIPGEILDLYSAPRGMERITCPAYLTLKLERGKSNDPNEVKKLQRFLIGQGESAVNETGIFDEETWKAVVAFQELYREELLTPNGLTAGNGLVGPSTRKKINEIYCEKQGRSVTGGRLVYLETTGGNSYKAASFDFDNKNLGDIFYANVGELKIVWPEKDTLMLLSKPNSQSAGHLFSMPATALGLRPLADVATPILRNIRGLTVSVSPDANTIVYGEAGPARYLTKVLDKASGETRPFPITTIPSEKCAWDTSRADIIYCAGPKQSMGSEQPETWYLGLSSNEDNIYAINTETDTVTTIYTPDRSGPDVSSIQVSEDGSTLMFTDKRDSSLWVIYLAGL